MTRADVADRLQVIREVTADDERAHGLQDDLFREVLTAIASGDVGLAQARVIAAEALTVDDIDFGRWMG